MLSQNQKRLQTLPAWQALAAHYQSVCHEKMADWFETDAERFNRFSLQLDGLLFDYSKNRVTEETLKLLTRLAEESGLADQIENMFTGQPVNATENRAVLHTALRAMHREPLTVAGRDIVPDIDALHAQMHQFTDSVRSGQWLGVTGKPIRDIVNIGIGGSDLGPRMAVQALSAYAMPALHCYFISDVDKGSMEKVLQQIDPERTLFIVSSKSFTTPETLLNAAYVRQWLQQQLNQEQVTAHFVAVTAAADKAKALGIPAAQIFPLWEWVGGRYSVWSAIGLPLALMIGMPQFKEFLSGAAAVDRHFREKAFSENIPVIMALLGIWNINFLGAGAHVIAPYAGELHYFRDHIQQMDMESNGKRVNRFGEVIDYATGPVIIGEPGCDSQHSFFQLLHQGPSIIPVDFILQAQNSSPSAHHEMLTGSALSQARALMLGRSEQDILAELEQQKRGAVAAKVLAPQKALPGNRPSNVIMIDKLTPERLGSLVALYEHKIFVQGVIWQINSFDQWGVELGKQLLPDILRALKYPEAAATQDASTRGLMNYFRMQQE